MLAYRQGWRSLNRPIQPSTSSSSSRTRCPSHPAFECAIAFQYSEHAIALERPSHSPASTRLRPQRRTRSFHRPPQEANRTRGPPRSCSRNNSESRLLPAVGQPQTTVPRRGTPATASRRKPDVPTAKQGRSRRGSRRGSWRDRHRTARICRSNLRRRDDLTPTSIDPIPTGGRLSPLSAGLLTLVPVLFVGLQSVGSADRVSWAIPPRLVDTTAVLCARPVYSPPHCADDF